MAWPRTDQSSRTLQVKDRWSLNVQSGAFTVLVSHTVVLLALIHSCRGQSEVIGPSEPIVAIVGEDVILPCYLQPVMNAFDMTVEWARPDLQPRFVHVRLDSVELKKIQHPSYVGRTSLFIDELKHGNMSLKLFNVTISDEGIYRCLIALARASTAQLIVGAVSSPVVHMTNSSAVVLDCESKGWYPEPELFWLDAEGNLLSAGPTETIRGPDELYTIHSTLTVERTHGNNITCRVQQKNIKQTRETHVLVPSTHNSGSTDMIIESVIGVAALVFISAAVFVVWKWRQKIKIKNKKRSPEDGNEQINDGKTDNCDNTGLQFVIEQDEETVALMAGREENTVGTRGQEEIDFQSEDHQVVAENNTHQDQFVKKTEQTRNMESVGRERKVTPEGNEKALRPTEEDMQKQDVVRRQERNDYEKCEEKQTTKQGSETLGVLMVLDSGEKIPPQHLHTHQEVLKERQEPMSAADEKRSTIKKKKVKKENKLGRVRTGESGQKQQENQREEMQPEAETQRVNDRTSQSERQRKEREKGEKQLKLQTRNVNKHLPEVTIQNGNKTEQEDQKEKDWDRKQTIINTTTERKAENKTNLTLRETTKERKERIQIDGETKEHKRQEGNGDQHVSDRKNQEVSTGQSKRGKDRQGNLSDITGKTETTAEKQIWKINIKDKVQEKEEKKDEGENTLPSASMKLKMHCPEPHTGKDGKEKSQKSKKETKEQPEESTSQAKVKPAERWKERLMTEGGVNIDETQNKLKPIEKTGELQTVQQLDPKKGIREQPEESFKFLPHIGDKCQEVLQEEEAMETDWKQTNIIESSRSVSEEQNDYQMDVEEAANMDSEHQERNDYQMEVEEGAERDSQHQEHMCQDNSTENPCKYVNQIEEKYKMQKFEEAAEKSESSKNPQTLSEGGDKCQEALQEEAATEIIRKQMYIVETGRNVNSRRQQLQPEKEKEPHVDQSQKARNTMPEVDNRTEMTSKHVKESKEQNDQIKVEEAANMDSRHQEHICQNNTTEKNYKCVKQIEEQNEKSESCQMNPQSELLPEREDKCQETLQEEGLMGSNRKQTDIVEGSRKVHNRKREVQQEDKPNVDQSEKAKRRKCEEDDRTEAKMNEMEVE